MNREEINRIKLKVKLTRIKLMRDHLARISPNEPPTNPFEMLAAGMSEQNARTD